MAYWGYHAMLNCAGSDNRVSDRDNIIAFTKALIKNIDMKAYGEPMLEHIIAPTPEEAGFSLLQMIETSSITAHFVDRSGDIFLDVFSCKPFEAGVVEDTVMEFFGCDKIQTQFFYRQAPQ